MPSANFSSDQYNEGGNRNVQTDRSEEKEEERTGKGGGAIKRRPLVGRCPVKPLLLLHPNLSVRFVMRGKGMLFEILFRPYLTPPPSRPNTVMGVAALIGKGGEREEEGCQSKFVKVKEGGLWI